VGTGRLSAVGQGESTWGGSRLVQDHAADELHVERAQAQHAVGGLAVALQVEFERQILKPVFHLIGFRLWV
jgi:hypothetical protein